MATCSTCVMGASGLPEGSSVSRPPLFNGSNYDWWKNRMKIFVQAYDIECWRVILKGVSSPMLTESNGTRRAKTEEEYNEKDWKTVQLNAKAINMIHFSLDAFEYNRIRGFSTAKDAWEKLETTFEGTDEVKESKINMLKRQYELFQMQPNESIQELSTRLSNIVNGMKSLGENIREEELVKKVLRSLTDKWDSKVDAIFEARNLKDYSLDELMGSLFTHELIKKGKESVFDKKKKTDLALNTVNQESDSDNSEEEIALMTRKFQKMYKKGGRRYRNDLKKSYNPRPEAKKETLEANCFECNSPDHFKANCPKLKKRYRKERFDRAMKATWSDSEASSSEEETPGNAIVCLMAKIGEECDPQDNAEGSQPNQCSEADSSEIDHEVKTLDISSLDLQDLYNALFKEYTKVSLKYLNLKGKYKIAEADNLTSQPDHASANQTNQLKTDVDQLEANLTQPSSDLIEELRHSKSQIRFLQTELEVSNNVKKMFARLNENLKIKIVGLTRDLETFTKGRSNLDMLLGTTDMRLSKSKAGIGYDSLKIQEPKATQFVKAMVGPSRSNYQAQPFVTKESCFYCNRKGHSDKFCNFKKKATQGNQTRNNLYVKANPSGPNLAWVPKTN
ncbi:uncharacterized protein LOC130015514 [Mercurialis annua]|uniref:uncharacterized protein LOC130015514 n=1 Tax=Mercurialis annua TaxID=3986 RepID=UPI0024AE85A0|nr:uncharacterized protein LOC130015514 [Mercurialis annua]